MFPQGKSTLVVQKYTVANGSSDLYTVPAGKKFIVLMIHRVNTTGGALTASSFWKNSGNTYRINTANNTSIGATTGTTMSASLTLILEAGDIISATVSGSGFIFYVAGILVDSDVPVYNKFIANTTNSETTLYEVPTGKIAYPIGLNGGYISAPTNLNFASCIAVNNGGGAPALTLKYVPSGDVLGATHLIGSASPTDNGNAVTMGGIPYVLNAGDKLSVISSIATAGTHVRIPILEVDV